MREQLLVQMRCYCRLAGVREIRPSASSYQYLRKERTTFSEDIHKLCTEKPPTMIFLYLAQKTLKMHITH